MKVKTVCLAVAAVALLAWVPAAAEETVAPAAEAQNQVQDQAQDACLDYTPIGETLPSGIEPALILERPGMEPVAPKPKPCRGCAPTYNGWPRISCDPCCYVNDIGVQICTS